MVRYPVNSPFQLSVILTPRLSNKVILLGKHIKSFQSLVKSGVFALNNIIYIYIYIYIYYILYQGAPNECQITSYIDIYIVFFEYFSDFF